MILFFTCGAAVLGPLAMGAISDRFGDPKYGFILATGFAALLFVSLLLNWILNPSRQVLQRLDDTEYQPTETSGSPTVRAQARDNRVRAGATHDPLA